MTVAEVVRADEVDQVDDAPSSRGTRIVTVAVVLFSAFAHLWQLGRRAMAHDEAIDAWFSWRARGTRIIEYDPVYHGPLRFYLEGFVLDHFGTTPGWTRLVAALAGIAATVMIATSHRLLGRIGAPCAAVVFTISPTILTVTRTGREDSLTAMVSLALLLTIANALHEPKPRHIVGAGALLAVSFGLKETTFIFGLAGAVFFLGLAVRAVMQPDGAARAFYRKLRARGPLPWMWSTAAFIFVFMFIFTAGFRYGNGFRSGLADGITYWWSQHKVGKGSQHWYFYGTIYFGYEWLLLLAAGLGLVVTIRRRSMIGAFFATMAIVQFAVYSWAGEKFAWLAVHPLVPAVLLGALGAQAVVDRIGRSGANRATATRLLAAGAAVLVAGTAVIAIRPAITDGADPRELLVTVQTSDRVPQLTDRFRKARHDGRLGPILVDERYGGSWPWAWYLHDFGDVAYDTIDPTQPLPPGYDAYIVSAYTDPPPVPDGYTLARFPLRVWWLPDYDHVTFGDIVRWLTTRAVWSPTASLDQFLIIKTASGVVPTGDAGG